jgi:hypothetical protein
VTEEIVDTPQEQPDAETAFIIVKELDGSFKATADLSTAILVNREANRADIRLACKELSEVISHEDLALAIASTLASYPQPSKSTAEAIRQALAEREPK